MGSHKIFLDTETTGLSPAKHQILTVGIIITDEKLKSVFEKEYLVRKDAWSNVNPFALRINKIDLAMHNIKAKPEKLVCKHITKDIKRYTGSTSQNLAIGHNLRFDFNFLGAMFERNDLDFPFSFDYEDTMHIARNLISKGKINIHSAKLKTLCKYFGYREDKFHNALEDVKATFFIYEKMKTLMN